MAQDNSMPTQEQVEALKECNMSPIGLTREEAQKLLEAKDQAREIYNAIEEMDRKIEEKQQKLREAIEEAEYNLGKRS